MKLQRLLALLFLIIAARTFGQAPQRFNYQAVARDASGNVIVEKTLGVRVSILDGSATGTSLYSETHSPATNKQGLFSIQVGGGITSGAFAGIEWGASPRFLKIEIDPAGGTSYITLGASQLLSVPYALSADRLVTPLKLSDIADVSTAIPVTDQILKWDGTRWTPSNAGGSSVVTSGAIVGSGTTGSPITIAPGASNGQVLQWNGTNWLPATVSGGVGDNWGTQSVTTTSAFSGNGTPGSPLNLSTTGVTNGHVMKFNGLSWAPAPDAGDNWGTAKVNTSSQLEGDGTPGNPLKLASQSAQSGQVLQWSGTSWIPGDASGFTLPYTGGSNSATYGFQVTNSVGSGIVGINSNPNGDNTYGLQGIVGSNTALNTAGVIGRHGSTGQNGYGVYGVHNGKGTGVYGTSAGDGGVGVWGKVSGAMAGGVIGESSNATTGAGVIGRGATGVEGTSTASGGVGVMGQAANGWAGWFSGKVLINSNSSASAPGLLVRENEAADYARIQLENTTGKYWMVQSMNTGTSGSDYFGINHFSTGDLLSIRGSGLVGIGNVNPTHRLDVNGNIRFTGALYTTGGGGLPGQTLHSMGGASSAVWLTETNLAFNKTYLYDQGATASNISTASNVLGNLDNMTFSTESANSRVIINFSHSQLVSNNTGDVDLQVEVGIIRVSDGAIVNRAVCNDFILNNKKKSFSYTHHCQLGAGNYRAYVYVGTTNTGKFNAVGPSGNLSSGQVTIQVIQE